MQNQGPPYQGPVNHGVFPDHTYNNQMGTHCPPSGYQPYMNGPYNVNNPRAHHYGSHQMQPRPPQPNHQLPYRGSYTPSANQYGPTSNQDMYRNHHSTYVGGNNRSMHTKPVWGDNSSGEMMSSYNHAAPHTQIMNNSTSMNVSSMRSPTHLASVPSPGSQHYRQMQSPGHSPQTWPQVQVPSPGMHPVARTTPSPLQTHARSPGHSQPFSPSGAHMPASVNMPSHSISSVPENPQPAQMVNQGMNNVMAAAGPLHSLQKMVMLDQNPDAMQLNCELPNENNCDQLSGCSSNSVTSQPEHVAPEETKDSPFATYYNLDENRLESEPQNAMDFKPLEYNANASASSRDNSSIAEGSEVVQPSFSSSAVDGAPPLHADCIQNGPVYADTPATPSIPALNNEDPCNSNASTSNPVAQIPSQDSSVNENCVSAANDPPDCPALKNEEAKFQLFKAHEDKHITSDVSSLPREDVCVNKVNQSEDAKQNDSRVCSLEQEMATPAAAEENQNVSKVSEVPDQSVERQGCESNVVSVKKEPVQEEEVSVAHALDSECSVIDKVPLLKSPARTVMSTTSSSNVMLPVGKSRLADIAHSPVKVVIHRIRTNSTNDIWHVPKSNGVSAVNDAETSESAKNDIGPKFPKVGPQIIMLSTAMSMKKFGVSTPSNLEPAVNIKIEKESPDNNLSNSVESTPGKSTAKAPRRRRVIKKEPVSPSLKPLPNATRKRGKPIASARKGKAATAKRKRKGNQRNLKKERIEIEEAEIAPKPKKMKPFTGPYLRITGSKQNPSSITVVNMAAKEEKEVKPIRTKPAENVKRPRVGHTSTLSPNYDAFNKDRTWLCAFCHKGSHCAGLGDLYGPYYVKDNSNKLPGFEENSISSSRGIRKKRRKSDGTIVELTKSASPRRTTKQNVKILEQNTQSVSPSVSTIVASDQQGEEAKEVWLHEDCAVWCQGVSLMGSQIRGLEDAIQEAIQNVCTLCKLNGATLGCWCKGCNEQYHFCCAKEKGCKLDIENFSLFCPRHKENRYTERQKRISAAAAIIV